MSACLLLTTLAVGLTAAGASKRSDGKLREYIYYVVSHDHRESTQVFRVQPDGRGRTAVTDGESAAYVYGPSPDGRHIALTVNHDLVVARPDGTRAQQLTDTPGVDWYPRFSPDGRWLLFESSAHSYRDLYKISWRRRRVVRLTNHPAGNFDGAWSPNGRHIAFASSRTGRLQIWITTSDGRKTTLLTDQAGDAIKPLWSPSGRWVAFIGDRDGQDDLFVVSAKGGSAQRLSPARSADRRDVTNVSRFSWHPTQDRLVFASQQMRRGSQIFTADVASQTRVKLSLESHDDREPRWSPDGRSITFSSRTGVSSNIFIMQYDGQGRRQVTFEKGRAWLPGWYRLQEAR